jgi:enamine deaminase RidA (YjgF/YER057c/UK114 family)
LDGFVARDLERPKSGIIWEHLMSNIVRVSTDARRGRAVIHNGVVFIGGQTATDRALDIRGQMQQVLAKIDAILAQAGSDKARLLSAQIWLKAIDDDFSAMNEVWDAWLTPDCYPARATAQCLMGAPDVLVEIIVTAAVQ